MPTRKRIKKKADTLQNDSSITNNDSKQNHFNLSLLAGLSVFGLLLILIYYYYRNLQLVNSETRAEVKLAHPQFGTPNNFFQSENSIVPKGSIETLSDHDKQHKDSKNKFFKTYDVSQLENHVNKVKITWHANFKSAVNAIPSENFHKKMHDFVMYQIKIIRKLLPIVMQPKVLLDILTDPTFSIEISHRLFIDGNGFYDPVKNTIFLALDIFQDEEFIKNNLKNELHSAAIRRTNFQKQSGKRIQPPTDPFILAGPFIENGWQKSVQLADEFNHALKTAENTIDEFIALFIKAQANQIADKEEERTFNTLLHAMQTYQPRIRELRIPYQYFKEFSSQLKTANEKGIKFIVPQKSMYPTIKPAMQMDAYVIDIADDSLSREKVVRYRYAKDETVLEKAKAFIAEHFEYTWRFADQGIYGSNTASRDELNAEKSSDFEELRPNIPYAIYKEWCDYFTKYHHIDDYCNFNYKL